MKLTLKNVKTSKFASHETECFTAVLYVDGVKVCTVENDGQGGPNSYYTIDAASRALLNAVEEWVKTLPTVQYHGQTLNKDLDWVLSDLMNEMDVAKRVARWTKQGKTVARNPADPEGTFVVFNAPPTARIVADIQAKHPTYTILNAA